MATGLGTTAPPESPTATFALGPPVWNWVYGTYWVDEK